MRNVLLASLAVFSAFVANTGCIPFGCGGFEGGGNRAYERNSEMILLCENGGFVATLDTSMIEGRYRDNNAGFITASKGEDGSLAFEIADNHDGTAYASQLGDELWTTIAMNTVTADHANVLCNDLAQRDWWTRPAAEIPREGLTRKR